MVLFALYQRQKALGLNYSYCSAESRKIYLKMFLVASKRQRRSDCSTSPTERLQFNFILFFFGVVGVCFEMPLNFILIILTSTYKRNAIHLEPTIVFRFLTFERVRACQIYFAMQFSDKVEFLERTKG